MVFWVRLLSFYIHIGCTPKSYTSDMDVSTLKVADSMKIFAKRLQELRKSKGLTQRECAEKFNMTANSYQRYEYGTRKPEIEKLMLVADYYDVSLDYLVGRSDNPERS